MHGDNAADSNQNVFSAEFLEFVDEFGEQSVMTRRQRTKADNVNVVIDSILSRLLRSLEERSNVDIPAHIRETRRDNFCAAVVTVLTNLSHEDTRTTTSEFLEFISAGTNFIKFRLLPEFAGVNAAYRVNRRLITSANLLDSVRDFTE